MGSAVVPRRTKGEGCEGGRVAADVDREAVGVDTVAAEEDRLAVKSGGEWRQRWK